MGNFSQSMTLKSLKQREITSNIYTIHPECAPLWPHHLPYIHNKLRALNWHRETVPCVVFGSTGVTSTDL